MSTYSYLPELLKNVYDVSEQSSNSRSFDDEECNLRTELCAGLCNSLFVALPQGFVPEDSIDRLVGYEIVRRILNIREPSKEEQDPTCFILVRAKRAFTVAVFIKVNV